jgi:hypothetical protein
MPTYTVDRFSRYSDDATEIDFFGFNFLSGTYPSNYFRPGTEQLNAPFVSAATAIGHDHANDRGILLDIGDMAVYGIPTPRVTRSTSDPLRTTFPFTP